MSLGYLSDFEDDELSVDLDVSLLPQASMKDFFSLQYTDDGELILSINEDIAYDGNYLLRIRVLEVALSKPPINYDFVVEIIGLRDAPVEEDSGDD